MVTNKELNMKRILVTTVLCTLMHPVFALDAACEPIIKSSEAKIAQPAWHSVTGMGELKLEAIKVDGESFIQVEGEWKKSPMSLDDAEEAAIAEMQEGKIKVTDCKEEDSEMLDEMEVTVLSYTSEVPASGLPAANVKLYIGKDDGLPYKFSSGNATATYRYKDVTAPEL